MNNAPNLPFPDPPAPAGPSFRIAPPKPWGSACCSFLLHAALTGLALLVALGGGNGIPGDGADSGRGAEGKIFVAGMLTLRGKGGAVKDAAVESDAKAARPEKAVQKQRPAGRPPAPEADAIPILARLEPVAETNRGESPKRSVGKAEKSPEQTVARQPKPARPSPAGADAAPAKARRERQAGAQSISGADGGLERAGDVAGAGAGDGKKPGGGSPPGSGGGAGGPGGQGPGFLGKVDTKPRVLSRSKVTYPETARKKNITGHVLLRFHLDEKGLISGLQVLKAEPPGIFEEAALASVKQWRFAPATKDGRPVPYWVELPMPFLLR